MRNQPIWTCNQINNILPQEEYIFIYFCSKNSWNRDNYQYHKSVYCYPWSVGKEMQSPKYDLTPWKTNFTQRSWNVQFFRSITSDSAVFDPAKVDAHVSTYSSFFKLHKGTDKWNWSIVFMSSISSKGFFFKIWSKKNIS